MMSTMQLMTCRPSRTLNSIIESCLRAGDRRVLVPAWMTDADRCRQLTAGDEPRVSMTALLQLVRLLKSADL